MTITRDDIIQHAIRILNERGLDKLSMREIAKHLDIKAASLYWHVKNKDELLALIAERISQRLTLDHDTGSAREQITQVLHAYRQALLEVRDSVKIFNLTPPTTPARMTLITTMLSRLEQLGVQADTLIVSANLLNNYVLAFVADELRWKAELPEGPQTLFGYPYTPDFDEQFRYGLEVLLSGLEVNNRAGRSG